MFTLVIVFKNGQKLYIHDVTDYRMSDDSKYFSVIKNGYRQFFNFGEVLYAGREFDLEEK